MPIARPILKLGRAAALIAFMPVAAAAQAPQQAHLSGTIVSTGSSSITIKAPDGTQGRVTLAPGYRLIGLKPAKLASISKGDFVGIGSVPDGKGGQKAVEVTIFPPSMAGTGEGSRPWPVAPQGTMTNATVQSKVKTVEGNALTLAYKGGTQKITVSPQTPIVAIAPAKASDLKRGAAVSVIGQSGESGGVTAKYLIVGLNGLVPPM